LQATIQYAELWSTLVARGCLHRVPAKYIRLVEAALSHTTLTAPQLHRLLATERTLPADMTTTMNTWLAAWQDQVQHRLRRLAHSHQQHWQQRAAATTQQARRQRHAAGTTVEPAGALLLAPALAHSSSHGSMHRLEAHTHC